MVYKQNEREIMIDYIMQHTDSDLIIYVGIIVFGLVSVMALVILGGLLVDIIRKEKDND